MTWEVSSDFWEEEMEEEEEKEEESDCVKLDWLDWDWARARATCLEIWGVRTARIWEVMADSELELEELDELWLLKLLWLLELWLEVLNALTGAGAGAAAT